MPSKIVSVPGGELQLQQLLARRRPHRARHQARLQQRLRLGGERQPAGDLGDIQRLDAERVARQRHRALHALVDGDRVHATQMLRVVRALAQPQMQRRFAVAVGGEADRRHRHAQFAVVVDLAVADQRRGAGEQRLIAGHQIDDRQPVVHQRDAAHHRVAGAIRAAVPQAVDQSATAWPVRAAARRLDRISPAMPHIGRKALLRPVAARRTIWRKHSVRARSRRTALPWIAEAPILGT